MERRVITHLNYFPMGFETIMRGVFHSDGEPIWTISLWDLKLMQKKFAWWWGRYLNYFPMGFETWLSKDLLKNIIDLNYFPMGFETSGTELWTHDDSDPFELFPYGIWNWINNIHVATNISGFELFPYGIWNNNSGSL